MAASDENSGWLEWLKVEAVPIAAILVLGIGAALAAGARHLWLYVAALGVAALIVWPNRRFYRSK